MSSRLNFFFSEAIRSLSTNIATSVAATLSMLVALLMVGVFMLVLLFVRAEATTVKQDAGRVKVFLQETVSANDVNNLRTQLERMPEVESVTYVSKDDALKEAREMFKDNKEILDSLPSNPFPASLRAKLKDPAKVKVVAKRMEGQDGVSDVKYGGQESERIISAAGFIVTVILVLALFLIGAATMLVSNTIKLSIFARRREIEVMKLVGASNMFVRLPFMIEGFLCGLAAACGAVVLIKLIGLATMPALERFHLSRTFDVPMYGVFLGLLAMGMLLGGFGSGLTIRKYLRV